MLAWLRMRAPGARRAGLPLSMISGALADDDGTAQRILRKVALHLRSGGQRGEKACEGEESGEHLTQQHMWDPRDASESAEERPRLLARPGAGRGVVALQGLEPRTCGL